MNKAQKRKIAAIIAKDATGRDSLLDGGRYCVLGGLLHEAGVPDSKLRRQTSPVDVAVRIGKRTITGGAALSEAFGLSEAQQNSLMSTNDHYWTVDERRQALLKKLERFKVT